MKSTFRLPTDRTLDIAILGVGSRPSALAQSLVAALNQQDPHSAIHLPIQLPISISTSTSTSEVQQAQARRPLYRITNSSPLFAAVQCDVMRGDVSLYAAVVQRQKDVALTLLLGLDGPPATTTHAANDAAQMARLRAALGDHEMPYAVLYGTTQDCTEQALQCIHGLRAAHAPEQKTSNWCWSCEKCSDADCEHRLFSGLL